MSAYLHRRDLLRSGAALGALSLTGSTFAGCASGPRIEKLVVLQLSGGNDGLSTVVPHADDAYHAARTTTRIENPLELDATRGLHPALTSLRREWDQGRLAIVEGVGYPDGVRSHFKSLEIWHTARARGRASGPGWIGRLADRAEGSHWGTSPFGSVVHLGRNAPYSLTRAEGAPIVLEAPSAYRWLGGGGELAMENSTGEMEELADDRTRLLATMRGVMSEADASSVALRETIEAHNPGVEYPDDAFAATLRDAAALVHGDLGLRVFSTTLTGFDTHSDQRTRHGRLMATLDGTLGAFLEDLATSEAGRSTAVLVYSEFGRRLQENGSKGTDHGLAAPAFLLGYPVRGGFHGQPPSLTELDDGNPAFTTDFRSILASLVTEGFGLTTEPVLAGSYPALDLLRPR